jgi:hypothetical protein
LFEEAFGFDGNWFNDVIQCIEMVLCYWKWLKKDSYWKRGSVRGKRDAKNAIQIMLSNIKRLMNREKGQGWSVCKFHEQLHVPDDIDRNGPPAGTHSGPTEHNHIEKVKKTTKQAKKTNLIWILLLENV